jgi:hypothetical protein
MGQFLIKMEGQLRFPEKKCHNFWLTTPFCMNESFPCRELHKNSKLKIKKYEYAEIFEKIPQKF